MLVVGVETGALTPGAVRWSARRHDDDATTSPGPMTDQGVFDVVFHALHDGEQVSIGFDCPLAVPAGGDGGGIGVDDLPAVLAEQPGLRPMATLLAEIGEFRSWTVITTSLERWRATTSVLVWQAVPAEPDAAVPGEASVDAFYALLRDGAAAPEPVEGVRNIAALIAARSQLVVDADEFNRSPIRLSVHH